ncbi:hypothetical protein [Rhizobium sp. PAMB 3182]
MAAGETAAVEELSAGERIERDGPLYAAYYAYTYAGAIGQHLSGREPKPFYPEEGLIELAAYVRKIGRQRATPAVMAQQLVITGHREKGPLQPAEEAGLNAFLTVLVDLDALAAAEAARAAAEAAEPVARKPVPIEETTLETVDGPLDTWGTK